MRRHCLNLIAVFLLSAPAHAGEASAWSRAFPATSRTGLSRAGASAGQVGVAIVEGNAALLAGLGILAFSEEAPYEREASAKPPRPANDVAPRASAEEAQVRDRARLRKLSLGEDLKVLSEEEAEELRRLRHPSEAAAGQVAKRAVAEIAPPGNEVISAPAGRSSFRAPVKGAATYKALSVAALVAFVADGGLRLTALLQGREPGYAPAVSLSRELIKRASPPRRPGGNQLAGTSFNAE